MTVISYAGETMSRVIFGSNVRFPRSRAPHLLFVKRASVLCVRFSLALVFAVMPVLAQEKTGLPTDEKAVKTYEKAQKYLHEHHKEAALDEFKKADKQDGGHCLACQKLMIKYGQELREWKTDELGAE